MPFRFLGVLFVPWGPHGECFRPVAAKAPAHVPVGLSPSSFHSGHTRPTWTHTAHLAPAGAAGPWRVRWALTARRFGGVAWDTVSMAARVEGRGLRVTAHVQGPRADLTAGLAFDPCAGSGLSVFSP